MLLLKMRMKIKFVLLFNTLKCEERRVVVERDKPVPQQNKLPVTATAWSLDGPGRPTDRIVHLG